MTLDRKSGSERIAAYTRQNQAEGLADHLRRCEGFAQRLDNYSRGLPLDYEAISDDDPEPTGRVIAWIILCAMIGASVILWAALAVFGWAGP